MGLILILQQITLWSDWWYSYTLALGGIVNVGSGITIKSRCWFTNFQKTKLELDYTLLLWVNRTKSNYRTTNVCAYFAVLFKLGQAVRELKTCSLGIMRRMQLQRRHLMCGSRNLLPMGLYVIGQFLNKRNYFMTLYDDAQNELGNRQNFFNYDWNSVNYNPMLF